MFYRGPRRQLGSWIATRPGEVVGIGQIDSQRLGTPGPDQGYALFLARFFLPRLQLAPNEQVEDVVAGCVGVALKRSALFGRAPIMADLEMAFTLFGFLSELPVGLWAEKRQSMFSGVAHHHGYAAAREIADLVGEDLLRLNSDEVCSQDLFT